MNKKNIGRLIVILVLIVGLSVLLAYRLFFYSSTEQKVEIKVLEKIDGYPYQLEDRDKEIYKDEFKNLKKILSKDSIDEEEYAKSISKLYVIDFYSLANKLNKYDVGGTDFIINDDTETFRTKAMDTYYKNVKDNTYDKRKQVLPLVTSVNIENIEYNVESINNVKYEGYLVDISWTYDQTIEAATEGLLTIINKDNKLYIVNIETTLS